MKITKVEIAMYKLVKLNEVNLPKYWPTNYIKDAGSRYFMTPLNLIDIDLAVMSGELNEEQLGDLHGLNSYVLSKMGKLAYSVARDKRVGELIDYLDVRYNL